MKFSSHDRETKSNVVVYKFDDILFNFKSKRVKPLVHLYFITLVYDNRKFCMNYENCCSDEDTRKNNEMLICKSLYFIK